MSTYYDILGVAVDVDFSTLKRAYYRCAKQCHPDTDSQNESLTDQFKQLVEAFNTLSDPERRTAYDEKIGRIRTDTVVDISPVENGFCILDTPADDLLEELVTGNIMPRNTHLSTFFRDLQSTEVFITFREVKNLCWRDNWYSAWPLIQDAIRHSPMNILYHYYAARIAIRTHRIKQARHHFRAAIRLGTSRDPELHLLRIRHEFEIFQHLHQAWYMRFFRHFKPLPESPFTASPEEEMRRALEHAVNQNLSRKKITRTQSALPPGQFE